MSIWGVHAMTEFILDLRLDGDNARLIATAPELLAELEHLVRVLGPLEDTGKLDGHGFATLNGARAAITKARGLPISDSNIAAGRND